MGDSESVCNGIGDKAIGGSDDQQCIAALFMVADQVPGFFGNKGFDALVEEGLSFAVHPVSVVLGQWTHGEFEILMDIEASCFVLLIEMIVATLVDGGINQAPVNEELPPSMIAVTG